ncbi:hypothetical protein [Dactylosporangium sp. NPDC048998]|uniref:hypothetical protein n=1 Tax=Dactylosporangium sp. NPDC048998 TaxID=3363976 RepID=UPI003722B1AE
MSVSLAASHHMRASGQPYERTPRSRRFVSGDAVAVLALIGDEQICSAVRLVGVPLGFAAEILAFRIIQDAWTYCMNMPWPPAYDIADSPRFSLVGSGLLFLVLYPCCFPAGFWLAWRFLAARHRRVRAIAACLAGLLLLGGAFTTDLVLNVSPPHGQYIHARCPAGRPPWWPAWLPLRTSASPVDFTDQG